MSEAPDRPAASAAPVVVLTIGHSNHPLATFLDLVRRAGATLLIDVRSVPASRRLPHFAGPTLARALADHGIGYAWLGEALGGRPGDPALIVDGRPDYEAMARRPAFAVGLDRVAALAASARPALMCAEREPLDCHRFLLVARHLSARGATLRHVLADGRIEEHGETERRLLGVTRLAGDDLFAPSLDRRLDEAYRRRSALRRR